LKIQNEKIRSAIIILALFVTALAFAYSATYIAAGPADDIPPSFDWRDHNGGNWMTSVKSQGICGSCWAFSAVGAVEAAYNIWEGNPNLDLDLSEEYLVSDCLSGPSCCGSSVYIALDFIRSDGIVDEACFPYTDGETCSCSKNVCKCFYNSGNCSDTTCDDRCGDWKDRLVTIVDIGEVPQSMIKQNLIDEGPLSASIKITGSGSGFDTNGIYRCDPDGPSNHAVVIVGYEDTAGEDIGYWIIKNSWGSTWNGDGYYKVGYGECDINSITFPANKVQLCGKTITEDTVLLEDLINCPGNGIIIGADNIILDCDGHMIDGIGSSSYGAGVSFSNNDGVTVKNCNIQEFMSGINMYGSSSNINNNNVYGNTLSNNSYGIYVDIPWNGTISHTIWNNNFMGNINNAYESGYFTGENYWDDGINMGNYWDDFENNKGYHYEYYIDKYSVDNYPQGWFVDPNDPILLSPIDNYNYKVCDNLNFTWQPGEGSNDQYYFTAKSRGNSIYYAKDMPITGTKLNASFLFIENEIKILGPTDWWVCNNPSTYPDPQCSRHWTIIYDDPRPTLLSPPNLSTLTPTTEFTWSEVDYATNYVVRMTGPSFPAWNRLYMPLGNTQSFKMNQGYYNLLDEGDYYWSIAAVCNPNPSIDEMKNYQYSVPLWLFTKK